MLMEPRIADFCAIVSLSLFFLFLSAPADAQTNAASAASGPRGGTPDTAHIGEWLDEIAARAAAQNEQYLEIMPTLDFTHTATIANKSAGARTWPVSAVICLLPDCATMSPSLAVFWTWLKACAAPVALSTDDEGVSRIDMTHEYVRAAETYGLSYSDLK